MAEYFARVELHGAPWPSGYASLHENLKQHNFVNKITDGSGNCWNLPTGLYHATDRIDDIGIVVQAVKGCADATGYRNEVIVMRCDAVWNAFLSTRC